MTPPRISVAISVQQRLPVGFFAERRYNKSNFYDLQTKIQELPYLDFLVLTENSHKFSVVERFLPLYI